MKKWILALLFFLTSPQVFAGIFDPSPTDRSVRLLGAIFGDKVGMLTLGGPASPLLTDIVEKFNSIVIFFGMIVVVYVAIVSVLNTAQEGTVMGKKWSAIWIPIRSILGMMLLVPAPGAGYSLIQITAMWIILQGIGAANSLWDIVLDGLATGAGVAGGVKIDPSQNISEDTAIGVSRSLLNASVCMETYRLVGESDDNKNANTVAAEHGDKIKFFMEYDEEPSMGGSGNSRFAEIRGEGFFGINSGGIDLPQICGSIPIVANISKNDWPVEEHGRINDDVLREEAMTAFNTKKLAISAMLNILRPLAKAIVTKDIKPLDDYVVDGKQFELYKKGATPEVGYKGYRFLSEEQFKNAHKTLIVPTQLDKSQQVKETIESGKINGWIVAGSFYFVLNSLEETAKLFATAGDQEVASAPDCNENCSKEVYNGTMDFTKIFNDDNQATGKPTNISKLNFAFQKDLEIMITNSASAREFYQSDTLKLDELSLSITVPAPSLPGDLGAFENVLNAFAQGGAKIMTWITDNLIRVQEVEGYDPIIEHSGMGIRVMQFCEFFWISSSAALVLLALIAGVMQCVNPGYAVLETGINLFYLPILGVISIFWTFGAMLGYYTPLIPFMIFTVAALGWMLLVVEAIIAAPIVALGLVSPAGDEVGRVSHGLYILLDIFLRPGLMIFGFLLAGKVYKAIVLLVAFTLPAQVLQFKHTLFSPLVVFGIYVAFILSLTNKSFSLIYAVPDKILRWLGQQGGQTDVSQQLQEAKKGGDSAAEHGLKGGHVFASPFKGAAKMWDRNKNNKKKDDEQ